MEIQIAAAYKVIPTLVGTLRAGPSSVRIQGDPELAYYVPPKVWAIR